MVQRPPSTQVLKIISPAVFRARYSVTSFASTIINLWEAMLCSWIPPQLQFEMRSPPSYAIHPFSSCPLRVSATTAPSPSSLLSPQAAVQSPLHTALSDLMPRCRNTNNDKHRQVRQDLWDGLLFQVCRETPERRQRRLVRRHRLRWLFRRARWGVLKRGGSLIGLLQ